MGKERLCTGCATAACRILPLVAAVSCKSCLLRCGILALGSMWESTPITQLQLRKLCN